jgi:hypothetical protein
MRPNRAGSRASRRDENRFGKDGEVESVKQGWTAVRLLLDTGARDPHYRLVDPAGRYLDELIAGFDDLDRHLTGIPRAAN